MRKVLVTGGAGFIGSNFIHYLLKTDPDVFIVNLDALTYAANLENLRTLPDPRRYRLVEGDICDNELVDRVLAEEAIEVIIHFAAESHVDRSIHSPGSFVRTNIVGTFTLLEAARTAWLVRRSLPADRVRFHHVSTDEVYGALKAGDPPCQENHSYAPNSPYAASKASSNHLVRAYYKTYGLPVTITNCSNNYGPYQFPEKLVPLMILNALKGLPLPIYGDGQQVRDWLYVEDHCAAIWRVVGRGRPGETYNVGGDNQPTNLQVVREICGILDELAPDLGPTPHDQLCLSVADRPGHDRRYALDTTKIRQSLGWVPKEDLPSGLRKTVRWYLNNPDWVEKITGRPEYQAWLEKNYRTREAKE
jgi:dTDP-glucose 4,6-dehydratase